VPSSWPVKTVCGRKPRVRSSCPEPLGRARGRRANAGVEGIGARGPRGKIPQLQLHHDFSSTAPIEIRARDRTSLAARRTSGILNGTVGAKMVHRGVISFSRVRFSRQAHFPIFQKVPWFVVDGIWKMPPAESSHSASATNLCSAPLLQFFLCRQGRRPRAANCQKQKNTVAGVHWRVGRRPLSEFRSTGESARQRASGTVMKDLKERHLFSAGPRWPRASARRAGTQIVAVHRAAMAMK